MIFSSGSPRRASARVRRRARVTAAIAGGLALATIPTAGSFAADVTPVSPAAYQATATTKLNSYLLSDIAGSAFVDKDGGFHWTDAYTVYDEKPADGVANTFSNTNMSTVSSGIGSSTTRNIADAFWANPGSLCYQLDKRTTNALPSPQEDDHCDIIGVWIDPSTGVWHAVVNDEFQFDPWETAGADATVPEKISSANHNNRLLLATSGDQGKSWQYQGAAVTSHWDDNGILDDTSSPDTTYPFGDSGLRLYVDYSSGYFYISYNVKIYRKPASSDVATWTEMARSPISDKMAPGTWEKYYNGSWSQPGIGGIDGIVGEGMGLNVVYDPKTDLVAYQGKGAHGQKVSFQPVQVTPDHQFTFADPQGNVYTANTVDHWIHNAAGDAVSEVKYDDPATGRTVTVTPVQDVWQNGTKVVEGGIQISQVDPATGENLTTMARTGVTLWEDPSTQRLYVPRPYNGNAITYDAYSGDYRIVGYDGNVYETADLSDAKSWKIVGTLPAGSDNTYLTSLDGGSLTNQNVSGHSFLTISDLNGMVTDVTTTAPTGPTSAQATEWHPLDTRRHTVTASNDYAVAIGGHELSKVDGSRSTSDWKIVPVADASDTTSDSGFYRVENTRTGQFLQVAGSTADAQRAMGAIAATGAKQPDAVPVSSSSLGTPGGSDQWYIQRVAPRHGTSVAGSTTYRLVNRNSGLALEYSHGHFTLQQQKPGDAGQYITFRQTTGSRSHHGQNEQ